MEQQTSMKSTRSETLRDRLNHEPQELRFGTSGRRGLVRYLTQLEVYINAVGELEYLQSLPRSEGGIEKGDPFYYAYDLRASSTRYVPEQGNCGEIAQALERAIRDAGMRPVNLGPLPTPALTYFALQQGKGSLMVTGSHIPFDRNGYKMNTSIGELLKKDEQPIGQRVREVRERVYNQPFEESPFDESGLFKSEHQELAPETGEGREAYIDRYLSFFGESTLQGKRVLVYQHSAVGRDLLVEILRGLGAEVVPMGRSEEFVPVDTENIQADLLQEIQGYVDAARAEHGPIDAVVSTDGDSDRPLVLGIDREHRVQFYGGDLLGMIVAEQLGADAVVVPISCNDAIDRGPLKEKVARKTKIGSPYVIAGMEEARKRGARAVCGWEANGGFLLGSDVQAGGRVLRALPTRDALLPILGVLRRSHETGLPLTELFAQLPERYSRAGLLKDFPQATGRKLIAQFSPAEADIAEVAFNGDEVKLKSVDGEDRVADPGAAQGFRKVRETLQAVFSRDHGFGDIERINYIDGIRIYFDNGEIAHVRPSGNADELRLYAVADSQERANEIIRQGTTEPDGLLRRLEAMIKG